MVGQETEKETQPSQSKKPKSGYVPLATLNRTNNNEITTAAASTKLFEEFDTFLSEPTVDWELDFSPCKFWKTNGHRFPRLATIARDVFGVPASSAHVERVFNTALRLLSGKKVNTKAAQFKKMLFIARNSHILARVLQGKYKLNLWSLRKNVNGTRKTKSSAVVTLS